MSKARAIRAAEAGRFLLSEFFFHDDRMWLRFSDKATTPEESCGGRLDIAGTHKFV